MSDKDLAKKLAENQDKDLNEIWKKANKEDRDEIWKNAYVIDFEKGTAEKVPLKKK